MTEYSYDEIITIHNRYNIEVPYGTRLTMENIRKIAYKTEPRTKASEVESTSLHGEDGEIEFEDDEPLTIIEEAKAALAIRCENQCDKFNRYCGNRCTCGGESRRREALETLAERLMQGEEII